jgi:hypothetical protein
VALAHLRDHAGPEFAGPEFEQWRAKADVAAEAILLLDASLSRGSGCKRALCCRLHPDHLSRARLQPVPYLTKTSIQTLSKGTVAIRPR